MGPVLDWSTELTSLRDRLTAGATPRFTAVEWFHFAVICYRLVLLLTHRVVSAPGLFLAAPQTPLTAMTGAGDAAQLAASERARLAAERCSHRCHGGNGVRCTYRLAKQLRERDDAEKPQRCPASTLVDNVGLLPDTAPHPADQLSLPSFYHLHLLMHHALLSCASPAAFGELLVRPARLLSLTSSLSASTGLLLPGLWLRDLLAYHAVKCRVSLMLSFPEARIHGGPLPGFLQVYLHFLPWQFQREEGENVRPRSVSRPARWSGCWRVQSDNMTHIAV